MSAVAVKCTCAAAGVDAECGGRNAIISSARRRLVSSASRHRVMKHDRPTWCPASNIGLQVSRRIKVR